MLGNPVAANTETVQQTTQPIIDIPQAGATPISSPIFTIPTTTTQMPTQAILQTSMPHKKNAGVKAFLFVIMFVALGFTTFFILKTMYPIEFANMFDSQSQMHASEITTETEMTGADSIAAELTGTEITGAYTGADEISGTVDTDTGTDMHASATGDDVFGELNDLGSTTEQAPQSDVARLTDYATQGNDFLAQGKNINNKTVIKYGMYISKKATTFLEDIANGKEITNLSGYFAQFDQYIIELKTLVTQPAAQADSQPAVSPTPAPNDIQDMTADTSTPPNTGIVAE